VPLPPTAPLPALIATALMTSTAISGHMYISLLQGSPPAEPVHNSPAAAPSPHGNPI
jgi:hypothetical protein